VQFDKIASVYEQRYSSPSDREKNKQTNKKAVYNKHQNAINMLDYQAITHIFLKNIFIF